MLGPFVVHAATLSPGLLEVTGERGQTTQSSFSILNTGASEQEYFLDTMMFQEADESGSPLFIPTKDDNTLPQWIHFDLDRMIVPALSKVDVPFSIVIPDDCASGGYHGAITVATTPSDIVQSNGAAIEAKTAILVLLTVEGKNIHQLELLDFTFAQDTHSLPFGTFQYRIQNQGNVHEQPTGEILVRNLFGQTIAVVDANAAKGRILPSSTREYVASLEQDDLTFLEKAGYQLSHLAIGPITADLNLSYADSQSVTAQVRVWVFPWELSVVVVLVAIAITLSGVVLKQKHK